MVRRVMPPGNGTRQDDYPLLVQKAVTRYVGGQLSLSLIMGASAAFVMWLFGITGIFHDGSRFALFFGFLLELLLQRLQVQVQVLHPEYKCADSRSVGQSEGSFRHPQRGISRR